MEWNFKHTSLVLQSTHFSRYHRNDISDIRLDIVQYLSVGLCADQSPIRVHTYHVTSVVIDRHCGRHKCRTGLNYVGTLAARQIRSPYTKCVRPKKIPNNKSFLKKKKNNGYQLTLIRIYPKYKPFKTNATGGWVTKGQYPGDLAGCRELLLSAVKCRKLSWFAHVCRHYTLADKKNPQLVGLKPAMCWTNFFRPANFNANPLNIWCICN